MSLGVIEKKQKKWSCLAFLLCMNSVLQQVQAEDFPVIFKAVNKAVLAAQMPGLLKNFRVAEGDTVKENEIIVFVDSNDLKLQKQRLQVTLEYSNKQLANAEQMLKKGLPTEMEIERFKTDIQLQNIDLAVVEDRIDKTFVKAPFPGKIINKLVRSYEWIAPGQPVVELAGINLDAVVDIPAKWILYLDGSAKRKVFKIFVKDINASIDTLLTNIAPEVDPKGNTIKTTWRVVDKKTQLRGGMAGILHFDDILEGPTLVKQLTKE